MAEPRSPRTALGYVGSKTMLARAHVNESDPTLTVGSPKIRVTVSGGVWWVYNPFASASDDSDIEIAPPPFGSGRWERIREPKRYGGEGNRRARRKAVALNRRRA